MRRRLLVPVLGMRHALEVLQDEEARGRDELGSDQTTRALLSWSLVGPFLRVA